MGIFRSGSKLKTPQVTQNWVISAVFVQNVWGSQCWPKVKCVRLHPRKIHPWDFMIPHSSSRETRSITVVLDSARKYDIDILWFCHDSKQQLYRYKKKTHQSSECDDRLPWLPWWDWCANGKLKLIESYFSTSVSQHFNRIAELPHGAPRGLWISMKSARMSYIQTSPQIDRNMTVMTYDVY